jgi:predicted O-methyltransferase YrrM
MLAGFDGWSAVSIDELVPPADRIQVQLHHLEGGGLNSSLLEIACLGLLARYSRARTIFEIGTFRGRTALNFAANSSEDCVVFTLDLPESERKNVSQEACPDDARIIQQCRVGVEYRGSEVEGKIRQLYGNSMTFDFSPYIGKIDIVFIDGAHHYAAVRSDTENAMKMLRPGGMIIWHDFGNFGDYYDVTRAVREFFPPREILQIEDTQLAVHWPERAKAAAKLNTALKEVATAS